MNKKYGMADCCAKGIPGATNSPKMTKAGPIKNAVAWQPGKQGLAKIPGAISGPK